MTSQLSQLLAQHAIHHEVPGSIWFTAHSRSIFYVFLYRDRATGIGPAQVSGALCDTPALCRNERQIGNSLLPYVRAFLAKQFIKALGLLLLTGLHPGPVEKTYIEVIAWYFFHAPGLGPGCPGPSSAPACCSVSAPKGTGHELEEGRLINVWYASRMVGLACGEDSKQEKASLMSRAKLFSSVVVGVVGRWSRISFTSITCSPLDKLPSNRSLGCFPITSSSTTMPKL